MMELFVFAQAATRHGAAVPLTRRGRARVRRTVRALDGLGVRFDRLLHGTTLRSLEMATRLARLLDGESVVTRQLERPPAEELLGLFRGARVAVVGHEPYVGALASWLVIGEPTRVFALASGSVLWLEGELKSRGLRVRAVLPRATLRRLARGRA